MKQTKTKSVMMILTLALLVLTLGLGIFFMYPKEANADEASPELVPLADADFLSAPAIQKNGGGKGVWWDANHTQMRLFYKVLNGTPTKLSKGGTNQYAAVTTLFIKAGDTEQSIAQWGFPTSKRWIDNMGAHTADIDAVTGEIWMCGTEEWLESITEVHFAAGFAEKDDAGNDTAVKTTKDYYLWNGDDSGWQTRITSFTATYGGKLEKGQPLDPAKLNVTAQFKDGTSGTVDGSVISVGELDTSELGAKTVALTYQDQTAELSVTVEEARTLTSIEVKNGSYAAQRWTYPDFADLEVYAHYGEEDTEGTKLDRSDFTVSGYDMWTAEGTTEGTVSYTHNDVTKTATFTINVQENTTTDKYLDVVPGKSANGPNSQAAGDGGTGFTFGERPLLSVPIEIKGFDLGYNLGNRNSLGFELIKGMHFVDYIEFIYDGEEKTLQELLTDQIIESAGTSDNGVLVFLFKDQANRAKVSQIHCKAGMQWPKQMSDHWGNVTQDMADQLTQASELLSDLVLKKDVWLYNGGNEGWLEAVESLTVTVADNYQVLQNAELDTSKLTVTAKYFGKDEGTSVDIAGCTVEFSSGEVGEQKGTVTYRGVKGEFTVKVVKAGKVLEKIELSGTTEFTAKRFEEAPALTGFTVTAYFQDETDREDVTANCTVEEANTWQEPGTYKIQVSYTYGSETKTAELSLTIEEPDLDNGLEVLHDYEVQSPPPIEWSDNFWGPTDWGNHTATKNPQLIIYFRAKGNITLPETGKLDQFGLLGGTSKGTHILDYILINGQPYETWKTEFGYETGWIGLHSAGPQGSQDGSVPYALWLNPGKSVKDNSWRESIQTITIKAGFQWATSESGDLAGAVVKQDITLWNAHDAGWQRAADSIQAKVKEGGKIELGTEDIGSMIEVKAVSGSEEWEISGYTIENYDKDTAGKQTVTIMYQGKECTLEITVGEDSVPETPVPESLALDKTNVTTEKGKQPDLSQIKATVKFTNGGEDVTFNLGELPAEAKLSDIDVSKAGDVTVTLTYTKDGVTLTATFTVTVTESSQGGNENPGGDQPEDPSNPGGDQPGDQPGDPSNPGGDQPEDPSEPGEADNGCGSVIGGTGIALAVIAILGAAVAVIIAARKKNN